MNDEQINNKFERHDRSLKSYIDLKLRAYTAKTDAKLKPFIWMQSNPIKTIGILMILFMLSAFAFHYIDFEKFFKHKGIELKESYDLKGDKVIKLEAIHEIKGKRDIISILAELGLLGDMDD